MGSKPTPPTNEIRKGNRASELFTTLEDARRRKAEWTLGGLPLPGAPPVSKARDVVATLDDALRHRVLDLEQRGKDAGVTERVRVALRKHWPDGAALPLHFVEPSQRGAVPRPSTQRRTQGQHRHPRVARATRHVEGGTT